MTGQRLRFILAMVLMCDAGHTAGPTEPETYRLLDLLAEAMHVIKAQSYNPPSTDILVNGAIEGMLARTDGPGQFFDARALQDLHDELDGRMSGVGIAFYTGKSGLHVARVLPSTPAEKAGIREGDIITTINDGDMRGATMADALDRLSGQAGEAMTLQVRRGGTTCRIRLTREILQQTPATAAVEDGIAVIRVHTLHQTGTVASIREALSSAGTQARGILLDLRHNPGGLVEEGVALADLFLENSVITQLRSRETAHTYHANESAAFRDQPIVVLIDGHTASAAEIVAGALQDHRRAITVGQHTLGKATVQSLVTLQSDYAAVRITTGVYTTPSGRVIHESGIVPDVPVATGEDAVAVALTLLRDKMQAT